MAFQSEQCEVGLSFLLDIFKSLNPKVYMETGCAQLGTLIRFKNSMTDGLSIGVDAREYGVWKEVDSKSPGSGIRLSSDGCSPKKVKVWLERVLRGRKIDFLFIDGDHSIEGVQSDWNTFSPFVRSGGYVAFHDYDYSAFCRGVKKGQGAVWMCEDLKKQGFQIETVPVTKIGTSYLRMP